MNALRKLVWLWLGVGCALQLQAATSPAWKLVWSDEFSQSDGAAPNSSTWSYDVGGGGWGNGELESYTSRRTNAFVQGGRLVIQALKEDYTGSDGVARQYTSGRLKTQGKFSWTYGRIEARMQIPKSQGIWPAFWTLGANITSVSWPTCGELDIMENIGKEPTKAHGTMHGPGYSAADGIGGSVTLPGGKALSDDFHLYAIEWQTNRVDWLLDNKVYFTVTPAQLPAGKTWVFDKPQFVILNVAVGGGWPGSPDATTTFPQKLLVDYVRVYARTNAPTASLQIQEGPADVKAMWPGEYPNALLQKKLTLGQSWLDIPTSGARLSGKFVEPVAPGFYRLSYR